jgi:DNA-binding NarL/FixJ family response regulator
MTDRIRVLIVDDHIAFAESLREVLGRNPAFELTSTAASSAEAIQLAEQERPTVVLMDQHLPDGSGAAAAARIFALNPGTAVVMLTGGGSQDDMLEAVEAGVAGYLIKTARVSEIADAISRAAAGEMLIPPATLAELLRRGRERTKVRADLTRMSSSLTPRERDVLRLMAAAKDTATIAAELAISGNTARGYVQTVLEKLQAHSRLEAVLRAQELGILG